MRVVFRTDASLQIGSGHVMRCLTLAGELRRRGGEVLFVCREHPGNLIGLIEDKGYPVILLPQLGTDFVAGPADVAHAEWLGVAWQQDAVATSAAIGEIPPQWLVIDHYAIDHRWEESLRPRVGKIMVIDDVADRSHACELLLDQNLYKNMEGRYNGLVPEQCVRLLGPGYALLRQEFMEARQHLRERDGSVKRILVFFGGSDPGNETTKALEAIRLLNRRDLAVDVVVGGTNPHLEEIKSRCASMPNMTYHCQINNIAALMAAADLAVGAGGSATWERCLLGLPALIIAIADNQAETSVHLDSLGCVWFCGMASSISVSTIAQRVSSLLEKPLAVLQASFACKAIVDETGCERVAGFMEQMRVQEKDQ